MSSRWVPTLLPWTFLPVWFVNAGVVYAMSGPSGERKSLLATFVDTTALPPPEPGFETEGLLWASHLNEIDPAYVLPGTFGILLFINFRMSASQQDAMKNLQLTRAKYPPLAPQRVLASLGVSILELLSLLPFVMPIAFSNMSSAVCLYAIGSAASQVVLGPFVKAVMSVKPPIQPLIPQVPQLKHKYRNKLSMDIWRPPSQHRGATVDLSPQIQLQESKGSQSARNVARPSGSQNITSGHHMQR